MSPSSGSSPFSAPTAPDGGDQNQTYDPLRSGLSRVASSWGWYVFFGILGVVAGILALALPGATVGVLATLLGIWIVVVGVFRLVAAITANRISTGVRVLFAIVGVLALIVGFLALRHLPTTVVALGVMLGVLWLVQGIAELLSGIDAAGLPGRGWIIASGIIGIITGAVLLIVPAISILVLAIIVGFYLVLFGIFHLGIGLRLRTLGKALDA